MDTRGDPRLAQWLDVVADILQRPLTRWPIEVISAELRASFDAGHVDWNRRDSRGRVQTEPSGEPAVDAEMVQRLAETFLHRHPLVHWYAAVPDIRPQSMCRVPPEVSHSSNQALITELWKPLWAEHALSLPIAMTGVEQRVLVVLRGDTDYTDGDLELAARVQRLLIGLHKQIEINRRHYPMTAPGALQDVGLTGREQAVLALLAEGYTAARIAHALGVSRRTVHKHLENLYRKLQVPDRLSAVLQAQALSLLQPDTSDADVLTRPIS